MLRQAKADVVAVAVAVVVVLAARQNILEFNCTYLPSYQPACLADEAVFLSSSGLVTELGNIAANFSYFHTRIMFNKDSSALESTRPIFLSSCLSFPFQDTKLNRKRKQKPNQGYEPCKPFAFTFCVNAAQNAMNKAI